ALGSKEGLGGAGVVRFERLGAEQSQLLEKRAQVCRAAPRRDAGDRGAAVREEPDSIPGVAGDLCQAERGVDRVIALSEGADPVAQETARVENDPDRMAALHTVELADEIRQTCS